MAVQVSLAAERCCGECAARCRGPKPGNCADGLDILRAVLAAGVREPVDEEGSAFAAMPVAWIRAGAAHRISAEHGLAVLQALHAGGVDVLARGPAEELPMLHDAAAANAPALVRWLVTEAAAPVEKRSADGNTPLSFACTEKAWAAAHALLDCGARVDVRTEYAAGGWWPVLLVANRPDTDSALLRRILAADRDSLLRCEVDGLSALHFAATENAAALKLLLGSGLPHLAKAINTVAIIGRTHYDSEEMRVTPLHGACTTGCWDAALALLAAGARVDIAGHVDNRVQTIAEWGRRSAACKHRGVKLAIAARAREHAAAAAKGLPSGGAGSGAAEASASASRSASTRPASSLGGSGSAANAGTGTPVGSGSASAATRVANTGTGDNGAAAGAGKQWAKARKGKGGQCAAKNRAEEAVDAASAPSAVARAAAAAGAPSTAIRGSAKEEAVAEAPGGGASNTCEEGSADAIAAPAIRLIATQAHAPAAAALNLPEVPGFAAAAAAAACPAAPCSVLEAPAHGSATAAGCFNTCEPGATTVDSNTCEPGPTTAAEDNICEPAEGATTAGARPSTAPLPAAESGEAGDGAGTAGATLIAALQAEGTRAAAVRRHLAALSELAQHPGAAAALARQGAIGAVGAAVVRHGASVAVAASPLLALLGAAAVVRSGEGDVEGGEVS
jgi:hypothetical protein